MPTALGGARADNEGQPAVLNGDPAALNGHPAALMGKK
jgi:hypothetical protein